MGILIQFVLVVIGFVMLVKGADWFVDGSSKIADKFGIPQLVIGLTIVAMGTSAPEAAVSISAAFQGGADIAIGNVLGSNILNIFLILGITAVITTVPVQSSTIRYEIPFVLFITLLMGAVGYLDGTVAWYDGAILWAFMIVYMVYLLKMAKKGDAKIEEVEGASENDHMPKLILLMIVGAALIVFGADVTVDAATNIARTFGMSERLIGLTLIAFGTSLPELITSATAALKGKSDIAVGNIVGSNIFNILFVLGTTALITPVPYASEFAFDTVVATAAVAILWLLMCKKKQLNRTGGIVLLICVTLYMGQLILG
ncbi:MAG: calcium/sodium antiporter [Lachnospiraceae bacterium]